MVEKELFRKGNKPAVRFIEDTEVIVYVESFKSGDLLYSTALKELVMFARNDVYREYDENVLVRLTSIENGIPIFKATSGDFIKEEDIATSNLYYLDRNIRDFINEEEFEKRVDKALEKSELVDCDKPLAGRLFISDFLGISYAVAYETPSENVNAVYLVPNEEEEERHDTGIMYKKMEPAIESIGHHDSYSAGYLFKGKKFDWDELVQVGRTAYEMLVTKEIESTGLYTTLDMFHQDGFDEGYHTGMATGIEEGVTIGKEEGTDAGYRHGFEEGYDYGVEEGFDAGYRHGYEEGFDDGVEDSLRR